MSTTRPSLEFIEPERPEPRQQLFPALVSQFPILTPVPVVPRRDENVLVGYLVDPRTWQYRPQIDLRSPRVVRHPEVLNCIWARVLVGAPAIPHVAEHGGYLPPASTHLNVQGEPPVIEEGQWSLLPKCACHLIEDQTPEVISPAKVAPCAESNPVIERDVPGQPARLAPCNRRELDVVRHWRRRRGWLGRGTRHWAGSRCPAGIGRGLGGRGGSAGWLGRWTCGDSGRLVRRHRGWLGRGTRHWAGSRRRAGIGRGLGGRGSSAGWLGRWTCGDCGRLVRRTRSGISRLAAASRQYQRQQAREERETGPSPVHRGPP